MKRKVLQLWKLLCNTTYLCFYVRCLCFCAKKRGSVCAGCRGEIQYINTSIKMTKLEFFDDGVFFVLSLVILPKQIFNCFLALTINSNCRSCYNCSVGATISLVLLLDTAICAICSLHELLLLLVFSHQWTNGNHHSRAFSFSTFSLKTRNL